MHGLLALRQQGVSAGRQRNVGRNRLIGDISEDGRLQRLILVAEVQPFSYVLRAPQMPGCSAAAADADASAAV